jgi:hypothetical protein
MAGLLLTEMTTVTAKLLPLLRRPLLIPLVAISRCDLLLGRLPTIGTQGAPHLVHLLERPFAVRFTNRLSPPVSISSRFDVDPVPGIFDRLALIASFFAIGPPGSRPGQPGAGQRMQAASVEWSREQVEGDPAHRSSDPSSQ